MLGKFYAAMGNAPEVQGALAAMSSALVSKTSVEKVSIALDRCMTECRFPVRLPDIFQRIPGLDLDLNAEKRLAWDAVTRFVGKWVRWNEDRTAAFVEAGAPALAPRILDTVRRTGGWTVYLAMSADDFPHQQKRFFEEYEAYQEIQHVAADPSRILEMPKLKQLAESKAIERPVPSASKQANLQTCERMSPAKARIMKAIAKVGKPRRI